MKWRAAPLIGVILALLMTSSAAALATAEAARAREDLDGKLGDETLVEVKALEQYFSRAREAVRLTAVNSAFRDAYLGDVRGGADAEEALIALEGVSPDLGEACLIDRDGRERVRVVDGRAAPVPALRRDDKGLPNFRQTLALQRGGAYQARPYVSPHTGTWVVSNSAPVYLPDGTSPGFVHLEVSIESFRKQAAEIAKDGVRLTVVDREHGTVIIDAARPQLRGVALGSPGEQSPIEIKDLSEPGMTTIGNIRVAFRSLDPTVGNANRWAVVASAPAVSLLGAIGFGQPLLFALGVLLFVGSMLGFRKAAEADRRGRIAAEKASRTDALTGVYNRRHAVEVLTAELSRGSRDGNTPSVLMLDLDHFKQINDVYGHTAGDAVIIEVGRRIRGCMRDYDVVARWGGEEFCVVLPTSLSEKSLLVCAERVRTAIDSRPVEIGAGKSLSISASIGAATAGKGMWSAEGVVDAADRALYTAKRRGRNQTVLFSGMTTDDLHAEEPESIKLAHGLALAANVREASPDQHCEEVADIAARIAMHLDVSESVVMRCRLGGWIHDVGKLAIPDSIIGKQTPLDEEERQILQSHVTLGAEIVGRIPALRDAASAVLHHHERWDGTGYPDRRKGDEIPIEARIVACADAYSAITAGRPYQPPLAPSDAIAQLRRSAGRSLDPEVVEALATILAEQPVPAGRAS